MNNSYRSEKNRERDSEPIATACYHGYAASLHQEERQAVQESYAHIMSLINYPLRFSFPPHLHLFAGLALEK